MKLNDTDKEHLQGIHDDLNRPYLVYYKKKTFITKRENGLFRIEIAGGHKFLHYTSGDVLKCLRKGKKYSIEDLLGGEEDEKNSL